MAQRRVQVGKPGGIFAPAKMAAAKRKHRDAIRKLKAKGAEFTYYEIINYQGLPQGKMTQIDRLSPAGVGFSNVYFAVTYGPDVFVAPDYANFEDGFPNVYAIPDLDTLCQWPWQPQRTSVICDAYYEDGTPNMYCPRNVLKSLVKRYDKLGIEVRMGVEYEVYAYKIDEQLLREKRYDELEPLGAIPDFWSFHKNPSYFPYAEEFMRRMEGIGLPVEVFHTELGMGSLEYAMRPQSALKAADAAMRSKLYFKQMMGEAGYIITFMTMPRADEYACGGHHHVSLWKNGKPLLYDPKTGDLSKIGGQFVAGICETLPDFHLLMRTTMNAYRRVDVSHWTPECNAWGYDNKCCAMRFIKGTSPSTYRFENRTPGADVNPYLSVSAMLAGGLYGIENKLKPKKPQEGTPDLKDPRWKPLSTNLKGSATALRKSKTARSYLGDDLVNRVLYKTEAELESWGKRKLGDKVTEWELDRYFQSA